ncbi:hypothetical protein TERTU_1695 [Teredinibacter turnerae T7901]|uniref:Uncharacterized protein n=1 Tax=Teredinibacter turnerae (strain ATCC 39867 / T7901) TaxID=377629 RepID=C5BU37_TERTT|nr:hypothetical protein TERTU_1695 [Teredinibacter turnerae T7901]
MPYKLAFASSASRSISSLTSVFLASILSAGSQVYIYGIRFVIISLRALLCI